MEELKQQWRNILTEFTQQVSLHGDKLIVIGCSTSEVMSNRIGTAGSVDVAEIIFSELMNLQKQTNVQIAFQCCEHLNRAIVLERASARKDNLEEVSVVPIRKAGGAMATYAFQHLNDPVVVEHIKADAGIDIGDTFIGMHLKHVVVPIRISLNELGGAHVTLATTRPKLIGGERAIYQ
ncbi:TIGR01440 family protein [Cytobacillus sp. FSL K6-0265]|uniref:TIGR01440 family protein n=1 Tax=Cytobacillus sp. FSL K6-0265 TaxID=2921448 RepID=UPI0030F57DD3